MTKRKTSRSKHQKDVFDTSEEESAKLANSGKCCSHVLRAVNFGRVKRVIKTGDLNICSNCTDSKSEVKTDHPEVWLCLQCGFRGCGRMSTHKHGLQHFKVSHSDCHSLVLSPSSGVVWCYDCDDEVPFQTNRNLKQCVEFVMKMKVDDSFKLKLSKDCSDETKSVASTSIEIIHKEPKKPESKSSQCSPKKKDFHSDNRVNKDIFGKFPVKGLRNLGNTCYFNSVMQNLSQTPLLFCGLDECCSDDYKWEVPKLVLDGETVVEDAHSDSVKLPLLRAYSLVNTFLQFLRKMMQNKAGEILNPNDIFNELQKKSPHFQNYLQQDSHELLRQFLDGIRQDEVKRQKRAILRHFDVGSSNSEISDDVRKLIKAYGYYASHSIIEKVFGGLLISTVLCEECRMSSQIFEPFMDMSLPLFEEKPLRNRKGEQESEEKDEYVLNKSHKDYSKPSKYQEKKMKLLEKKEKKKHKKSQIRTTRNQSPCANKIEEESRTEDQENEETNGDIGMEKSSDDENQCMSGHVLSTVSGESFTFEERLCNPSNLSDNCDSCVKDEIKTVGNTFNCGYLQRHSTLKKESLVLFEEVVFIDEDVPTLITNDSESNMRLKEGSLSLEHSTNGSVSPPLDSSLSSCFDKSLTLTEIDSLELDKRMQALSMQVKEVRIRKDSDRQESILSSSGHSSDGADISKANSEDNLEEGGQWSQNLSESQTQQWLTKSLTPLQPRKQVSPLECSIDSCLSHFTKPELLMGSNRFRCENCTEIKRRETGDKKATAYSNASKQLLVFSPPAVLTLHLKRFQQLGMSLRKVNRFVEFPLKLNLAPYCSSACLILPHMSSVKDEILYSLYGIVEHSGRLTSGHYTAYVKAAKRTLNKAFMNHHPLGQCDLEQLLYKFSKQSSPPQNGVNESSACEGRQWFYISDSHVKEVSEAQVLKCQAYLLFYERVK